MIFSSVLLALIISCTYDAEPTKQSSIPTELFSFDHDSLKIIKSNAEWKKILSPMAYNVTREKGTEVAFSGKYWNHHETGVYECVCCGNPLFSSQTKFNSGTGWPSYYAPIQRNSVDEVKDRTSGMLRTEVVCSNCNAHLGHVFNDGPKPTGLRYCVNSAALKFKTK